MRSPTISYNSVTKPSGLMLSFNETQDEFLEELNKLGINRNRNSFDCIVVCDNNEGIEFKYSEETRLWLSLILRTHPNHYCYDDFADILSIRFITADDDNVIERNFILQYKESLNNTEETV